MYNIFVFNNCENAFREKTLKAFLSKRVKRAEAPSSLVPREITSRLPKAA